MLLLYTDNMFPENMSLHYLQLNLMMQLMLLITCMQLILSRCNFIPVLTDVWLTDFYFSFQQEIISVVVIVPAMFKLTPFL